ncbi:MAG TPA: MMPL family transporter [Candidatus Lumbricidophila sp.]|nr:MMPL family transporter [Candidatus Lumbricidophila sp.]
MSRFLYRLGHFSARRRGLVVAVWVLLAALLAGSAALFAKGTDDAFGIPGSESQQALDALQDVAPAAAGTSAQLVVITTNGATVNAPAVMAAIGGAEQQVAALPQVAGVLDPWRSGVQGAISADSRAALISIPLKVALADVTEATKSDLASIAHDLEHALPGAEVKVGGEAFSDLMPKIGLTELAGLAVAVIVLLLLFRSLTSAGVPVFTALLGVGLSVGGVYLATAFAVIPSSAPMLGLMLGLAVGIDYSLFILSRHRQQLTAGADRIESIARATATAGSAVVFAGLTVIIALLGLLVTGIPTLTSMGLAAAATVAVAVVIAITLTPALLSFAGTRVRPWGWRNAETKDAPVGRTPVATRWVRFVTARPILTVVAVVGLLGIVTLPATGMRLALPDNGNNEHGSAARETFDAVTEHFGEGATGPLLVTAKLPTGTDPRTAVTALAAELAQQPGVASVPLAMPDESGTLAMVQVVPTSGPQSPATVQLVHDLRERAAQIADKTGLSIQVTGFTAIGIDVSTRLADALLPFGLVVVGLSLLLLLIAFRSILVPIKAAIGYLLSVGATIGITTWVFVDGNLADFFGVAQPGSVISFFPIILMGVLFGLAMDYEMFLVSRMREAYAHGIDAKRAVHAGFTSAAQVVTAAALIMFAVFVSFVPDPSPSIKPIAFGLAVGVFIDAFLVRMTLVPAVMTLLGRSAWWIPKWLDRVLPNIDIEGAAIERAATNKSDATEPVEPEPTSARG